MKQNMFLDMSSIFSFFCEHIYAKRNMVYEMPFEDCPNRAWTFKPAQLCPVK